MSSTALPLTRANGISWTTVRAAKGVDCALTQRAGCPPNNELEYYTSRSANSWVSSGVLTIRAQPESYGSKSFTSARMNTEGNAFWTYGRFEARIKLPTGQGMWPAFWMMPETSAYGGWPNSGEIDNMEYVQCQPGNVYGTTHSAATGGTGAGGHAVVSNVTAWHVYSVEWTCAFALFLQPKPKWRG